MPKTPTKKTEPKVDELVERAIESIREFQAKGYFPLMLVFLSPKDGFEHALIRVPGGLDPNTVLRYLTEASANKVH